jgi:hypothetical protein
MPYVFRHGYVRITARGFPHSEIPGSKVVQHLTGAYRSRPRPSSTPGAKASANGPYYLDRLNTLTTLQFSRFAPAYRQNRPGPLPSRRTGTGRPATSGRRSRSPRRVGADTSLKSLETEQREAGHTRARGADGAGDGSARHEDLEGSSAGRQEPEGSHHLARWRLRSRRLVPPRSLERR